MKSLTGETTNRPVGERDAAIMVTDEVRRRLQTLLMHPSMRGVGYSEFINRACEAAEDEIHDRRHYEMRDLLGRELLHPDEL